MPSSRRKARRYGPNHAFRPSWSASSHVAIVCARRWSVTVPPVSTRTAFVNASRSKAPSTDASASTLSDVAPSATPSRARSAAMAPAGVAMTLQQGGEAVPRAAHVRQQGTETLLADHCRHGDEIGRKGVVHRRPRSVQQPCARRAQQRCAHAARRRSRNLVRHRPPAGSAAAATGRRRGWSGFSGRRGRRARWRRDAAPGRVSPATAARRSVRSALRPASSSSATVQRASSLEILSAISAAAARVNVRQRMRSGAVPPSNRRSTRSVSTLVLPVPAEAPTQTEAAGSDALCWAAVIPGVCAAIRALRRAPTTPCAGPGGRSRSRQAPAPAGARDGTGSPDRRSGRPAPAGP